MKITRLPQHVGIIPDGNRRWAAARGLPRPDGYAAGVAPGLELLRLCVQLGIGEASVYGFTKENVHRPRDQVDAFRQACIEFAEGAVDAGAALQVFGDTDSAVFPDSLRPYTGRRTDGEIRVNLLVNYSWRWDLSEGLSRTRDGVADPRTDLSPALATADVPRVDLVVRWGGRRRLSGFLPIQCAYADVYVIDSLWPDMEQEDLLAALYWYQRQDVTLGG